LIWQSAAIKAMHPSWKLTCAAHSPEAMKKAASYPFDAALISPIFTTGSHPEEDPIPRHVILNWLIKASLPIYALGGITLPNLPLLKDLPFSGVAGIAIFNGMAFSNTRRVLSRAAQPQRKAS